jgi:hypothetical protein
MWDAGHRRQRKPFNNILTIIDLRALPLNLSFKDYRQYFSIQLIQGGYYILGSPPD